MTSLKQKLKNILKKIIFGRLIKKHIFGQNNRFEILTKNFLQISILMKGNDNLIHIDDGTLLKKSRFIINGNNNRIFIGSENDFLDVEFVINANDSEVVIGTRNTFPGGHDVFCVSGDVSKIHVGNGNSFMWGNHNLTAEGGTTLSLGNNCLLSDSIYIKTGDSHSIFDKTNGKKINQPKSVQIGNHVWIAPCVRILKGVTIKDDSVVGTNSIVTHPITKGNVVIAGSPAKIVKDNIEWKR